MKNKFITLLLLLSILLFISACGQGSNAKAANTSEENTETNVVEEEEQTEEETTDSTDQAAVSSEKNESEEVETTENETETVSETEQTEAPEETVEETVNVATEETNVEEQEKTETVTAPVWLYFSDNQLLEIYRTEVVLTASSEQDLPVAALKKWIEGPESEDFYSLVSASTQVYSVEEIDGTAVISLSDDVLDSNFGSSAEQFLTEQMAMIMQQFGYEQTKILVEGKEVNTLFGHVDTSMPIEAGSPDNYTIK